MAIQLRAKPSNRVAALEWSDHIAPLPVCSLSVLFFICFLQPTKRGNRYLPPAGSIPAAALPRNLSIRNRVFLHLADVYVSANQGGPVIKDGHKVKAAAAAVVDRDEC
jgi:hypothetical protein